MICRLTLDRNIHRSELMSQFLIYGHVLSTEEAELYADYELKKNPPTLENFKEQVINIVSYSFFLVLPQWAIQCLFSWQINRFESLHERVSKMEDGRVFCSWLQLNIRPFKRTLMNVIKRWSWMFKEHLLNHVDQR